MNENNLFKSTSNVKKSWTWSVLHDFLVGWLVVLRINVDLAIFQSYLDLEAGDNQSLKIQVARPGIEPRSSCSASQQLNHSTTTAPVLHEDKFIIWNFKSSSQNTTGKSLEEWVKTCQKLNLICNTSRLKTNSCTKFQVNIFKTPLKFKSIF